MKYLLIIGLLISCAHQEASRKVKTFEGHYIASVNLKLTGEKDLKDLTQRMESWVKLAKERNAKIILFPELVTLDFFPHNPPDHQVASLIQAVAGQTSLFEKRLQAMAKTHDILIVGASTFKKRGKSRIYNRAYIVFPDGKLKYQDKNFPTPWEKRHGISKNKNIKTFKYADFKFVVLTCHDAEFPSLSKKLTRIKPDIIFVPSQTDSEFGFERVKRTSQARAVEHMSYVLMTGTAGDAQAPWHSYVGRNLLLTPQNKYFTEPEGSDHKEQLSLFAVDIEQLRLARKDKGQVYPARDDR